MKSASSASVLPDAPFDLFNLPDAYHDDPYPFFRALRDNDPLHRNADGSVLVTRYEDVKAVWRDLSGVVNREDMYRKKFGEGPLLEHHTTTMLFRDPPDHDRLRDIVNPFFNQSSIERLRSTAEDIADRLLDEIDGKREIDFISDFASRIPGQVICDVFGVPRSDGPRIRDLGAQVLLPLNPAVTPEAIRAGHAATASFKEYLLAFVNQWRARPIEETPGNIISALVASEQRGETITEDEMLHMCIVVLNGGHETTTNLLGLSTLALLHNREQYDTLGKHPAVIGTGIEECLRYSTPLQLQGRRTTREITIPGGTIAPNTEIIIAQASANRDEYAGALTLVGEEMYLPYQRPPLSKGFLERTATCGAIQLRPPGFYETIRCDVRLGSRVVAIERQQHLLHLDDGTSIEYGQLVLAPGARARRYARLPHAPGRVHYLRTLEDAAALSAVLASARRLAIVGAGYVGMEVAASANQLGIEVAVLEAAPRVMQRSVGAATSNVIEAVHAQRGVRLHLYTRSTVSRPTVPARSSSMPRTGLRPSPAMHW